LGEQMLQVENIHFQYGSVPIIEGVSFEVQKGKLCALFGPNGCGKTTLFKCCLRFLACNKGTIRMNGLDLSTIPIRKLAQLVSYVPQEHKPPFPYLVKEVVLMGRTPHLGGIFKIRKTDREKVIEAMHMVGITHLADLPYNQLSGGQRQMVLMARAIAQDTLLLFLDEPTSALDFSNQIRIWKIMRRIVQSGKTILACTHDPNHVLWFSDQVIVMNNRGIVAEGLPHDVMNEPTLDRIYSGLCSVQRMNRIQMVVPSDITESLDTIPPLFPSHTRKEMAKIV